MEDNRYIILFDGVCNLCNSAVNLVIDHDPKGKFAFAPLQSKEAEAILAQFNLKPTSFDSMVLIKKNKVHIKSAAALEIAKEMEGFYPALTIFKIIPAVIRNFIYDIVAKYRYKFFGKRDTCRVPTSDIKNRFLAGL